MSPGLRWNELLFDGAEAFAVDWAVEDARRRELVADAWSSASGAAPTPDRLGPPAFILMKTVGVWTKVLTIRARAAVALRPESNRSVWCRIGKLGQP